MSPRITAWLAWTLFGLMTCLAVVLFGAALLRQAGSTNVLQLVSDALWSLAVPVGFALVAALIVSRQPRNTIGWLLLVPVGDFLLDGPLEHSITRLAPHSPEPTLPLLLLVWFSSWSWLLLIAPLLAIALLFPSGQPPSERWRWVGRALTAWVLVLVVLTALKQPLRSETAPQLELHNPIGVLGGDIAGVLSGLWVAGWVVLALLCLAALFVRYRRAGYTEREQIKWLLYACAVFLVLDAGGYFGGLTGSQSLAADIWQIVFALTVAALPVAIGIAILRYRLYDIDVIIRRTLVYGALSGLLVVVYLALVVGLQGLFRSLTGQESNLAIVVSTLGAAALFQPLRGRVQHVIDRRFYRSRYDAARTLAAFSARLRDEVDLTTLSEELVQVVDDTMQPAHVSLWLRPVGRPPSGPT